MYFIISLKIVTRFVFNTLYKSCITYFELINFKVRLIVTIAIYITLITIELISEAN